MIPIYWLIIIRFLPFSLKEIDTIGRNALAEMKVVIAISENPPYDLAREHFFHIRVQHQTNLTKLNSHAQAGRVS